MRGGLAEKEVTPHLKLCPDKPNAGWMVTPKQERQSSKKNLSLNCLSPHSCQWGLSHEVEDKHGKKFGKGVST